MAKRQLSKIVGKNIVRYRRDMNLTQEKLAEITGIDQTAISRMENGTVIPKFERLEAIAEALHCPVAELFYKEEDVYSSQPKNDLDSQIAKLTAMLQPLSAEKRTIVLGTMDELVRLLKNN